MEGRGIFRKLKEKALTSCVTPAYTYGLETMELAHLEFRNNKRIPCEKNWIRIKNRGSKGSRKEKNGQPESGGWREGRFQADMCEGSLK